MSDIIIMVSIVVYLLVVVAIGIQYSKKNKSSDDFYLGGRKLGPFVTAMSAEASDMSSWLLMGLPGVAYLTGVAECSMDSDRSCNRNLHKLAYSSKKNTYVFTGI